MTDPASITGTTDYQFQLYEGENDDKFVRLSNGAYVLCLKMPWRGAWLEDARKEFADDPDLIVFIEKLCDAMATFLGE